MLGSVGPVSGELGSTDCVSTGPEPRPPVAAVGEFSKPEAGVAGPPWKKPAVPGPSIRGCVDAVTAGEPKVSWPPLLKWKPRSVRTCCQGCILATAADASAWYPHNTPTRTHPPPHTRT